MQCHGSNRKREDNGEPCGMRTTATHEKLISRWQFINLASGSNLRVGGGLESCTSSVNTAQAFKLDGRSVTLIDTPGFDDTSKSDSDILRMIAAFLATG
jgi:hypothetical protein